MSRCRLVELSRCHNATSTTGLSMNYMHSTNDNLIYKNRWKIGQLNRIKK